MNNLSIIYGPNKIFSQKASHIDVIDDQIRDIAKQMFLIMKQEGAIGLGGNMVGVLKRIIVVDLMPNNISDPYIMINPEIIDRSTETQTFTENSLSFPGIEHVITRSKYITINYQSINGDNLSLKAEGLLSSVLQHEIDYLDGKIFLDHLSKMKKDLLVKKTQKFQKIYPPHIHTSDCKH